jgi:citrate synthase
VRLRRPLVHGRANQDCLEFLREVVEEVGESATAQQVEKLIRDRLASNKLVFGFGHAVLRMEDPRALVVYEYLTKTLFLLILWSKLPCFSVQKGPKSF